MTSADCLNSVLNCVPASLNVACTRYAAASNEAHATTSIDFGIWPSWRAFFIRARGGCSVFWFLSATEGRRHVTAGMQRSREQRVDAGREQRQGEAGEHQR